MPSALNQASPRSRRHGRLSMPAGGAEGLLQRDVGVSRDRGRPTRSPLPGAIGVAGSLASRSSPMRPAALGTELVARACVSGVAATPGDRIIPTFYRMVKTGPPRPVDFFSRLQLGRQLPPETLMEERRPWAGCRSRTRRMAPMPPRRAFPEWGGSSPGSACPITARSDVSERPVGDVSPCGVTPRQCLHVSSRSWMFRKRPDAPATGRGTGRWVTEFGTPTARIWWRIAATSRMRSGQCSGRWRSWVRAPSRIGPLEREGDQGTITVLAEGRELARVAVEGIAGTSSGSAAVNSIAKCD